MAGLCDGAAYRVVHDDEKTNMAGYATYPAIPTRRVCRGVCYVVRRAATYATSSSGVNCKGEPSSMAMSA